MSMDPSGVLKSMISREPDWEEAREQLRTWREDNSRHSNDVVELWLNCLEAIKHKLGDERWMIEEQVFIAAIDCNNLTVASECFSSLNIQFPGSSRVLKLKSMRYEALERYDEALAIYERIIREDETTSMARKRKVALLKSQGRTIEAIKELTEYLNKFMSDAEAWQELGDLLLKEGDYAKAAFCMEELILSNPHNHLYYTRYAEIKYTQGGQENMDLAKNYFCQAIKLNPNNIRALYGLLLTCSNIYSYSKLSSQKKKEIQKMSEFARKKLAERYKNAENEAIPEDSLEDSLALLSISEKS